MATITLSHQCVQHPCRQTPSRSLSYQPHASLAKKNSSLVSRPATPSTFPSANAASRSSSRSLGQNFRRSFRTEVKEVGSADFEQEVLQSELPVLVDFWSTWCGPCRLILPVLDSVEKEYAGRLKVVKIETDANPALVEQFKVYGLPTLVLFQGGKEVEGSHWEGAIGKAKLQELISTKLTALASK